MRYKYFVENVGKKNAWIQPQRQFFSSEKAAMREVRERLEVQSISLKRELRPTPTEPPLWIDGFIYRLWGAWKMDSGNVVKMYKRQ